MAVVIPPRESADVWSYAMYGRMGPGFDSMGEFHHSNTDTMDKISPHSLEVVGRTILRTIELLDKQPL